MNKKRNQFHNNCPICEGIIWGKGQQVLIEGAKITVCQSCAQYGKKIYVKAEKSYAKGRSINKPITTPKKQINKADNLLPSLEVVSDYSKKIKDVRTLRKLNQDQFAQRLNEKPSLIRRIEAGKVIPTVILAKKIEKVYNIKLLKKPDNMDINTSINKYIKKSNRSSLADIAFIKKKK